MWIHMTNEQTLFLIVSHYLYISSGVVILAHGKHYNISLCGTGPVCRPFPAHHPNSFHNDWQL